MKLSKRLTDAVAQTVKLKPGEIAWDGDLAGFGVRLHPSGRRAWQVQYSIGRRVRPMSLGPIEGLPASRARAMAVEILAKVKLGQDPAADRRKVRDEAGDTFGGEHLKRYLAHKRKTVRERSYEEIDRHLVKHASSLHPRLIREIDRKLAASLLAKIAGKSGDRAADSVRASAGAYFGWLIAEGLTDANPFAHTIKRTKGAEGRSRTPSIVEMVEIWQAADDETDHSRIIRLLMLLALRKNEVGRLEWAEVDLEKAAITIPARRMKAAREHVVALSAAALEILHASRLEGRTHVFGRSGETGFSGWSRCKARLDARILANRRKLDPKAKPMTPWTVHDLRRGVASALGERLDIAPHIVASLLAHRTFQQGTEGVYNKASYLVQMRAALDRWAAFLLAAVKGTSGGKVVPLAKPLPPHTA
jgi:integrase